MSARLSFEKPIASCAACDVALTAATSSAVRLSLTDPPLEAWLCSDCRGLLWDLGPEPALPPPRLRNHPGFRLPLATESDLDGLLRALTSGVAPTDLDLLEFLDRCRTGGARDLEPFAQSLETAATAPHEVRLAGALLMAARLRMVLAPVGLLERLATRSEVDSVPLCLAAYCARHAEPLTLGTSDKQALLWVSRARQQLLAATPSAKHPMFDQWVWLRSGVELASGNAAAAKSILMRAPKSAMRARLHTGLAAILEGNHAAADRELHAAMEDPLASADPENGNAALWNYAVRSIVATRWDAAVACLANLCRLDIGDMSARLLLAHGWLRRSGERVAREVTASVFDDALSARLRNEQTTGRWNPSEHLDGVLLHVAMLLRSGEHDSASRALDTELPTIEGTLPPIAAAEVLRMRWRIAWHSQRSDLERVADALAFAKEACELDPSAETSREVTWLWMQSAERSIARGGITEFVDFVRSNPEFEPALLRTLGVRQAALICLFLVHQVQSEFRPMTTLGLDWSQRRQKGADALSSHVQCYSSLAAHQLPIALSHGRSAMGQQVGFLPLSFLDSVLRARRAASDADQAAFDAALRTLLERLLRSSGGPPN